MATGFRNDRFQLTSDNRNQNGDKYERQESRKRTEPDENKSTDEKSSLLQCSFCQKSQPSSKHLTDHLMLCGNKTDQCPNCRKYVRRAIFAYHYENNCANLDEPTTPTPPPKDPSAQRPSSVTSKPTALKENDPADEYQEDRHDFTAVRYRSNGIDRPPSTTSNRTSLDIQECKFCNQRCVRSDYEVHQKNCLQNPVNTTKKQQRKSLISDSTESRLSTSEDRRSKEIVGIPCEFCNEQIDFNSWAAHTNMCREKENRRIADRAAAINREPVIEELSCEHCHKEYPLQRLQIHERSCEKNPENIARATRLVDTQSSRPLGLYNGLSNTTKRDPTLSSLYSAYSSVPSSTTSKHSRARETQDILHRISDLKNDNAPQNERFSSHLTVDIKPPEQRSRVRERDSPTVTVTEHQPPKQSAEGNSAGLLPINTAGASLVNTDHGVSAYDTSRFLTNGYQLSGTQSLPPRPHSAASLDRTSFDRQSETRRPLSRRSESPSVHNSRPQSASRGSLDAGGSLRPQATKATTYLPLNTVQFHSPREADVKHQPKLNEPNRSGTRSAKSSWRADFLSRQPWKP